MDCKELTLKLYEILSTEYTPGTIVECLATAVGMELVKEKWGPNYTAILQEEIVLLTTTAEKLREIVRKDR